MIKMVQKLKCWKKTKNNKDWVTFRRTKDFRGIDIIKYREIWGMQIRDANSRPILNKDFKTKSQALKKAKSYMKKHDIC